MIAVVDYGIGNLRSAEKALLAVGAKVALVTNPDELSASDAIVVPGVGSFGACIDAFRDSGFEEVLKAKLLDGVPILGICVGMQMLFADSAESPQSPGLGIFSASVHRFQDGGPMRVPQMQWNIIRSEDGELCESPLFEGLGESAWVYFVHSYAAPLTEDSIASCEYGEKFSAAVRRDNLYGVQFHPEKSSRTGLRILANFSSIVERARS